MYHVQIAIDRDVLTYFDFNSYDAALDFAEYIRRCIYDYICESCCGNTECPLEQFQDCQHNPLNKE